MRSMISKLLVILIVINLLMPLNVAFASDVSDGEYIIKSAAGECLLNAFGTKNTAKMTVSNRDGSPEQIFILRYRNDGTITLQPSNNTDGRIVDIKTDGVPKNGDSVHLFDQTPYASKHWIVETIDNNKVIFRASLNRDLVLTANGASHRSGVSVTTYTGDALQQWVLEPISCFVATEPPSSNTNTASCSHSSLIEERTHSPNQKSVSDSQHYGGVSYKLICKTCKAFIRFDVRMEYSPHIMLGNYCKECSYSDAKTDRQIFDEVLTDAQNKLDLLGIIPVIGDAVDVVNGVIYFARGYYLESSMSLASVIPSISKFVIEGSTYKFIDASGNKVATATKINLDVKPTVQNNKLSNHITELYKGQKYTDTMIGNGTMMDAIRNELLTGEPTFGTFHSIKGQETINGLNKLIKSGNLSPNDMKVAESLLIDLMNALAGK